MWRKIQAATGLFCIILYMCAALWAAYTLVKAGRSQKAAAEKEFNELRDFASSAGVLGFMGLNFKKDIENAFLNARTLQALIISAPDGQTIELEKVKGAIVKRGAWYGFDRNAILFAAPFSAPLRLEGARGAEINALASCIDYDILIRVLRTALFAVLLTAALSFAVLMLSLIPRATKEADAESPDDLGGGADSLDGGADGFDGGADGLDGGADGLDGGADGFDGGTNGFDGGADGLEDDLLTNNAPQAEDESGADGFESGAEALDLEQALFSGIAEDEKAEALEAEQSALADDRLEDAGDYGQDSALADTLPEFDELEAPFTDDTALSDEAAPSQAALSDEAALSTDEDSEAPSDEMADTEAGESADEQARPKPQAEEELVYEGFGDELKMAEAKTEKGLLAAAARIYERDSFSEDKESAAFTAAFEAMLKSADEDEEDLCIAAAEWQEGENSTQALIEQARDFFGKSAEVYERAKGGVYLILGDTALDEAFNQLQEFHGKVSAGNAEDDLLVIGLSAKSGRLVDAPRLLKEARRALEKGREDDALPIVAFRADARKYNQLYRAGENAGS